MRRRPRWSSSSRACTTDQGTARASLRLAPCSVAMARPTNRPSTSTTGPPDVSGTSGASRRSAPVSGRSPPPSEALTPASAMRVGIFRRLPVPRSGSAWRRPSAVSRSAPDESSGPVVRGSATSPGTRGSVSTSARSAHGARATILPCSTPRPVVTRRDLAPHTPCADVTISPASGSITVPELRTRSSPTVASMATTPRFSFSPAVRGRGADESSPPHPARHSPRRANTVAQAITPTWRTTDPYHRVECDSRHRCRMADTVRLRTAPLSSEPPWREPASPPKMEAATQDHVIAAPAHSAHRFARSFRPSKRLALRAAAAVVLIASAVALVAGIAGGGEPDPIVARIPSAPTGLAASGDAVWVAAAGSQAVWPIDPATGRQAGPGIRTGGAPSRLAVGAKALWIADSTHGSVIPVQTRGRRVYRPIGGGADVTDLELAAGALWVLSSAEGLVRAIEPGGRPLRRLSVGAAPVDLAASRRWVVVAGASGGTLTRIDARTRRQVGPAVRLGGVPVAAAGSGGTAWVAGSARGTVGAVDLPSGRIATPVAGGRKPVAVAADGHEIWVLCSGDRTLARVDGRSGEVLARRELNVEPTALALDDGAVWVASGAEREVLRIER